MRVVSWNVNGLRAIAKKGFHKFLSSSKADVICLQEVRALPEQLDEKTRNPKGWHTYFMAAERKGYSGVAIYSKKPADAVVSSVRKKVFDIEGRFLLTRFGRLSVASVYFPKGSRQGEENDRVKYKLEFYKHVFKVLAKCRRYGPTLVTGDFNTAHTAIDLARPKSNEKTSGFLPEERKEFDRWVSNGWIDTFRARHVDEEGHYTWWRQWGGARENNVGWRIDYVLASQSANKKVTGAFIWPDQLGSDHCPVGVDLEE